MTDENRSFKEITPCADSFTTPSISMIRRSKLPPRHKLVPRSASYRRNQEPIGYSCTNVRDARARSRHLTPPSFGRGLSYGTEQDTHRLIITATTKTPAYPSGFGETFLQCVQFLKTSATNQPLLLPSWTRSNRAAAHFVRLRTPTDCLRLSRRPDNAHHGIVDSRTFFTGTEANSKATGRHQLGALLPERATASRVAL